MEAETVALLGTPAGVEALRLATAQPDPSSVSAAQVLRAEFAPELAAAALTQADLRRRGVAKFGDRAHAMFFTRDGLEQATRPEVAAHHAARFVAAGVSRVVDLGCGIGSDALAFAAAGLEVVCVELDPATAAVARLNLGDRGQVVEGNAESLATELVRPGDAVFCDPARRTAAGRLWRLEDFTPPWSLVEGLLGSGRSVGVKLGPALPHALIPASVEAEWVSHRGDTVEVALWSAAAGVAGARAAMVLPGSRLVIPPDPPLLDVTEPGAYVYEPDGAVIRAGGVAVVGQQIAGALVDPKIAYLTSDTWVDTPFAAGFAVTTVLPYSEKVVRRWLRDHEMGSVEIKKRGVDVDPAQLRKRLALRGPGHCTLILTRTPRGALAIIARRPDPPGPAAE
jgi:SAM-dependent methyltransferase